MKLKYVALFSFTALLLTGCGKDDSVATQESTQRAQPLVEEAMRAERDGKTDEAVTLYRRALRSDSANAVAHFNLALLLHDRKKDYIGAYYHYQEYLDLSPSSEKAELVREQMAVVKGLLAEQLAQDITNRKRRELEDEYSSIRDSLTEAQIELSKLRTANAEKEKTIEELERKLRSLENIISAMKEDEEARKAQNEAGLTQARSLASEVTAEDDVATDDISAIRDLANEMITEDDGGQSERNQATRDAVEGKVDDELVTASPTPGKKYLVRPGDTWRQLAREAYGDGAQWTKLRDANRSTTNPNGRLRAGETVVIP